MSHGGQSGAAAAAALDATDASPHPPSESPMMHRDANSTPTPASMARSRRRGTTRENSGAREFSARAGGRTGSTTFAAALLSPRRRPQQQQEERAFIPSSPFSYASSLFHSPANSPANHDSLRLAPANANTANTGARSLGFANSNSAAPSDLTRQEDPPSEDLTAAYTNTLEPVHGSATSSPSSLYASPDFSPLPLNGDNTNNFWGRPEDRPQTASFALPNSSSDRSPLLQNQQFSAASPGRQRPQQSAPARRHRSNLGRDDTYTDYTNPRRRIDEEYQDPYDQFLEHLDERYRHFAGNARSATAASGAPAFVGAPAYASSTTTTTTTTSMSDRTDPSPPMSSPVSLNGATPLPVYAAAGAAQPRRASSSAFSPTSPSANLTQPASMPTMRTTHWESAMAHHNGGPGGADHNGHRHHQHPATLQRRLSHRDTTTTPASPGLGLVNGHGALPHNGIHNHNTNNGGSISSNSFETWTGRRPPEALPEYEDDAFQGGIDSSNVSPFTRDGRRPLPPSSAGSGGAPPAPVSTSTHRQHSLGPVGSGRRSSTPYTGLAGSTSTVFNTVPVLDHSDNNGNNNMNDRGHSNAAHSAGGRPFIFDENDSDDDNASGFRSGPDSRRHSVASFPSAQSHQSGFTLPTSPASSRFSPSGGGGGSGAPFCVSAPEFVPSGAFVSGSSALRNGDGNELSDRINSLQLTLDHRAAGGTTATTTTTATPTAASPAGYYPAQANGPPSQAINPARRASAPNGLFNYPVVPGLPMNPLFGGAAAPQGPPPPLDFPFPVFPGGAYTMGAQTDRPSVAFDALSRGMAVSGTNSHSGLSPTAQPFHRPIPRPLVLSPPRPMGSPESMRANQISYYQTPDANIERLHYGQGTPLRQLPDNARLFIIEFKAGRTDVFFSCDDSMTIANGDVLIVEGDRGTDLGCVVSDCITPDEMKSFRQHQLNVALCQQLAAYASERDAARAQNTIDRLSKELRAKRIMCFATQTDLQLLPCKADDEANALAISRPVVAKRNPTMRITDAEWQFDRKKLTLYYMSITSNDFRLTVRDLFKIFKARVWLSAVERIGEGPTPPGRF